MTRIFDTPEFANEQEEANWWDSPEGQAASLQVLLDAEKEGTLGGLTPGTREMSHHRVSLVLAQDDVALAQARAAQLGVDYRAYLAVLVHEQLNQPSKSQALRDGASAQELAA